MNGSDYVCGYPGISRLQSEWVVQTVVKYFAMFSYMMVFHLSFWLVQLSSSHGVVLVSYKCKLCK